MKIYNAINNQVARKVLAEVKKQAKNVKLPDYTLDLRTYVNCREQGFALENAFGGSHAPKVAFSENRNSDDIVVYYGERSDFSMNTNIPNDTVYETAAYFKPNQYARAAKFILAHLGLK